MAIKTFKHKGLKKFFESKSKAGIQAAHASKIERVLDRLRDRLEINDTLPEEKNDSDLENFSE